MTPTTALAAPPDTEPSDHAHGPAHGPTGFVRRYIFSTDHKVIGIQYIVHGAR